MTATLFSRVIQTTLRDAFKLKARMLERNLISARVRCPECKGMLHGRLAGPKKHIRFWCDGPCGRQMME
jgi:hypothetical protein